MGGVRAARRVDEMLKEVAPRLTRVKNDGSDVAENPNEEATQSIARRHYCKYLDWAIPPHLATASKRPFNPLLLRR